MLSCPGGDENRGRGNQDDKTGKGGNKMATNILIKAVPKAAAADFVWQLKIL